MPGLRAVDGLHGLNGLQALDGLRSLDWLRSLDGLRALNELLALDHVQHRGAIALELDRTHSAHRTELLCRGRPSPGDFLQSGVVEYRVGRHAVLTRYLHPPGAQSLK